MLARFCRLISHQGYPCPCSATIKRVLCARTPLTAMVGRQQGLSNLSLIKASSPSYFLLFVFIHSLFITLLSPFITAQLCNSPTSAPNVRSQILLYFNFLSLFYKIKTLFISLYSYKNPERRSPLMWLAL